MPRAVLALVNHLFLNVLGHGDSQNGPIMQKVASILFYYESIELQRTTCSDQKVVSIGGK